MTQTREHRRYIADSLLFATQQNSPSLMTITEIATLRLTPPYTWDSSRSAAFFHAVGQRQEGCSGHPLFFFQDVQTDTTIYLISGWASVHAHEEWIASARNQELLRMAEGLLEVKGLTHTDIDFTQMPVNAAYMELTEIQEGEGDGLAQLEEREGYDWKCQGKILDAGYGSEVSMGVWMYKEEPTEPDLCQNLLRREYPRAGDL